MLELTKSNEDYLEAIGLLSEKNGTAQVRDIAEMLKVKMPSVTSAVKQLADMGLVEYTPVSYTHLDVYKRQPVGCGKQPLLQGNEERVLQDWMAQDGRNRGT